MIAVWIIGVLFIIAGYFVGIRRIIKAYKYRGKLQELCWIVRIRREPESNLCECGINIL